MIKHIFRPLDRYVLTEFWKIFSVTALGFPILLIVIDLTDHVQRYLEQATPARDIALSYLYLDSRLDVHGPAGRGAFRDGILDRRVYAALRGHGGESVGDQLLSAYHADSSSGSARVRARSGPRGVRPDQQRAA